MGRLDPAAFTCDLYGVDPFTDPNFPNDFLAIRAATWIPAPASIDVTASSNGRSESRRASVAAGCRGWRFYLMQKMAAAVTFASRSQSLGAFRIGGDH